ncbi:MAG: hypothetical protein KUL77_03555 [Thermomonas sp.]|uniref:hypothetical protein n=1 Tax=Thermomonas sp. TaxID=1971895 RepID=UPI001EB1A0D1|nr:hypothetical protein [Thermomonas sp.]MBV2208625.1 hypothetical protein [Thermomonas sp.]
MTAGIRYPLAACLLAFALALLAACQPAPDGAPTRSQHGATAVPEAAERPVDAVYFLRDRLLARDGAGFAKIAVPPELYAPLETAWSAGRSRWPLDELPLDARIPRMLAALQAPNADKALMKTFKRQFAGADADIDQAVRTLVVFGSGYIEKDPSYNDEERKHTAQALHAIGRWAVAAPLADPKRAQPFFSALSAAAVRTGIDGRGKWQPFISLGMTQSLNRLSPFFATLIAQLREQYGLDIDASLRSVHVTLLQQLDDRATLRLQYTLAGQEIDALLPAVRLHNRWYLEEYVQRAELSAAGISR